MMHAQALPLHLLSWFAWKLVPGRAAIKLAEFSHTESGSGLDMLSAVEETPRREMRLRYFRHALDELEHARLFGARARALAEGQRSRAEAVLEDSAYIQERGIRSADSLFSQMGEIEFLAFVWVHEARAAVQFDIYQRLLSEDRDTVDMFERIAKDERFHISYSRAELDRYAKAGDQRAVRKAVWTIHGRRFWQAWLRLANGLGHFMTGLWLALFYFLMMGPFTLVARMSERTGAVLVPPADLRPAAERAREMG